MSLVNIWLHVRSNDSFVSCFVHSFRVSCVRFVYRAFVSCIVRFSYRSCEALVRFSFASFAFSVRLRFVRIVNIYDPGSVPVLCLGKYTLECQLSNWHDISMFILNGAVGYTNNILPLFKFQAYSGFHYLF